MLKNGNPSGDPQKAQRSGAQTRAGSACLAPAIRGKGRCRMHGGLSTGPRTLEGLERRRRARWKHGGYAVGARERAMARALKEVEETRAGWAEHGREVHPVVKVSRRWTRILWNFEDPLKKYKPYFTQWAKEARALRRKRARQARRMNPMNREKK